MCWGGRRSLILRQGPPQTLAGAKARHGQTRRRDRSLSSSAPLFLAQEVGSTRWSRTPPVLGAGGVKQQVRKPATQVPRLHRVLGIAVVGSRGATCKFLGLTAAVGLMSLSASPSIRSLLGASVPGSLEIGDPKISYLPAHWGLVSLRLILVFLIQ